MLIHFHRSVERRATANYTSLCVCVCWNPKWYLRLNITPWHYGKYFASKWDLLKSIRLQFEKLHRSSLLYLVFYISLFLSSPFFNSFFPQTRLFLAASSSINTNILYGMVCICINILLLIFLSGECIENGCGYCSIVTVQFYATYRIDGYVYTFSCRTACFFSLLSFFFTFSSCLLFFSHCCYFVVVVVLLTCWTAQYYTTLYHIVYTFISMWFSTMEWQRVCVCVRLHRSEYSQLDFGCRSKGQI